MDKTIEDLDFKAERQLNYQHKHKPKRKNPVAKDLLGSHGKFKQRVVQSDKKKLDKHFKTRIMRELEEQDEQ